MDKFKIVVVGLGKIARDQHLPALRASPSFELVAAADPHAHLEGVPSLGSLRETLEAIPNVAAVALCTPPQVRFDIAQLALRRGLSVLLEKPPGISVSEVHALTELAREHGATLFTAWHSRYACAIEPARAWLASRTLRAVRVSWKEDVRVWHPGQQWIWQAGGLGVFDPGINALSILTHLSPKPLALKSAQLSFPRNRESPIAARLQLIDTSGVVFDADFDFRQTGPQSWDIEIDTDAGQLRLSLGGTVMTVGDNPVAVAPGGEYPNLYARFAELMRGRRSDVDCAPLQLVADAFLCGRRVDVEPFVD